MRHLKVLSANEISRIVIVELTYEKFDSDGLNGSMATGVII